MKAVRLESLEMRTESARGVNDMTVQELLSLSKVGARRSMRKMAQLARAEAFFSPTFERVKRS